MQPIRTTSKVALSLGLLALLSGCASINTAYVVDAAYNAEFRVKIDDASKLPEQDQSRLKQIKFIESAVPLAGTAMGQVVGLSCKLTVALFVFQWTWRPELNETNGQTPKEAARTQLLVKAMQKGANAVAAASCIHKDGIDWGNNCFESWVCTGEAVLVP